MSEPAAVVEASPRLRAVAVGGACVVAALALLPVQFLSLVVFDTTGLDTAVPGPVFAMLLPGLVTAAIPAVVAASLYDRRRGLGVGLGVCLVLGVVAVLAATRYGVCGGAGC